MPSPQKKTKIIEPISVDIEEKASAGTTARRVNQTTHPSFNKIKKHPN
jgi:hypothetical protein